MTTAALPSLVLSAPPATPPLTDADVASLRSTHGRVAVVSSKARTTRKGAEIKAGADWRCAFRKPTPSEYKVFRSNTLNPARAADAQESFARVLVVYPSRVEFGAMLERFPGIPAAAAWSLKKLCGLTIEEYAELGKSHVTEEQLDEWEAEHFRVAHLMGEAGGWEVVYRMPSRLELKTFRGLANDPKKASDAVEVLARQCVLYPSREGFAALLEEYPGIPEASVDTLTQLAQVESDEEGKG
jgi:hypothetical protein